MDVRSLMTAYGWQGLLSDRSLRSCSRFWKWSLLAVTLTDLPSRAPFFAVMMALRHWCQKMGTDLCFNLHLFGVEQGARWFFLGGYCLGEECELCRNAGTADRVQSGRKALARQQGPCFGSLSGRSAFNNSAGQVVKSEAVQSCFLCCL